MKLFCLASLYKQQTTKKKDYQKGDENAFLKIFLVLIIQDR